MVKFITAAIINRLKKRLAQTNKNLQGEQLYLYESGTQYCVVALVNTTSHQVLGTFALDVSARRDLCLVKSFIRLIEATRTPKLLTLIA